MSACFGGMVEGSRLRKRDDKNTIVERISIRLVMSPNDRGLLLTMKFGCNGSSRVKEAECIPLLYK